MKSTIILATNNEKSFSKEIVNKTNRYTYSK